MLSPPIPCVARGSSLIIVSSISTPISVGDFTLIRCLTNSTACSLVRQSQIPSQPRMTNSSVSSSVTLSMPEKGLEGATSKQHSQKYQTKIKTHSTISGSAVIICSSGGSDTDCLYFKSPMLRDKLRLPLTRPNELTKPPAALTRSSSRGCMGL